MKKNKIIFWTATIIFALWEAVMPVGVWLVKPELITFGTKALGYPDYFSYAVVIAKVLGVIAIVLPKIPTLLKEWAYAGFTFTLIFAFISHACVDKNIGYMIMPLVFLGILAISYVYGKKINLEGKKGSI